MSVAVNRRLVLVVVGFVVSANLARAGENWPQFRGPGARGVSDGKGLPDTWDTQHNVTWEVEIPGRGWSSPIVWGDKIFVTTAVNDGPTEKLKKGLYFGGQRKKPSPHVHHFFTLCIDLKTGKALWKAEAHKGQPVKPIHIKNSYASETPVTDGRRVYAYFGNVGLFCYDFSGKELWSRKWEPVDTAMGWGTASSPVLHGDRIYIVNDNQDQSFMEALDKETGETAWRVDRNEASNWATPYVWAHEGRAEIVTPGSRKVRSYDLEGKLLWELTGMSKITIATPYTDHGLLYVTSGYVMDGKRPIYAIKPTATNDITLQDGATGNEHVAWCQPKAAPYNPSTLVYGDYLYVLYDRGFFGCFDAKTGETVYGKRRIRRSATAFTASPWAYEGKVFCLSEDGDTFVIKAGPEYELIRINSLDELTLATPAIVGRSLILRTDTRLYRIEEGGTTRADDPATEPVRVGRR